MTIEPATLAPAKKEQLLPWRTLALPVLVILVAVFRVHLTPLFSGHPAISTWFTVLVSISLQALPFLVLGVVLSACIATFVPADALTRWLPRNPAFAVPVAAVSGALLPGCECASVPIAGSLVSRGVKPAIALTFLLAAPAINPIVLISTAVAFTGQPIVVVARFVGSLVTAVVVGWIWLRMGRDSLIRMPARHTAANSRLGAFVAEARHDLLHAGGFLVLGASVAATINVVVPRVWLDTLGGNLLSSVLILAAFAVIVAICSEADAFVAVSLTQFPLTARLVFMVVGPVIDVKLFSMQVGTFGRRFATRFAPLTLVVAVVVASMVGILLL